MATTKVENAQETLRINTLTTEQYNALPTHPSNEFWIITDALEGYYTVMPEPIAAYKDLMTLYIGETTDDFITGYTYKCVEDATVSPATYSWVQVTNDPIIIRTWNSEE